MTNRFASFTFCLLITSVAGAQNLVQNPSFEVMKDCPKDVGRHQSVEHWYNPTSVALDYFNRCSKNCGVPLNVMGNQEAKTGDAYIGLTFFSKNNRGYAQTELKEPLKAGNTYTVEFSVSLSEKSKNAIGNIGAYFTLQKLENKVSDVMEVYESADSKGNVKQVSGLCRPQVKNKTAAFVSNINDWVTISGTFKAKGGEKFMTIGNFFTTSGTPTLDAGGKKDYAYYFIDDIAVYQSGTTPEPFTREVIMPEVAVLRNTPVKITEAKKEGVKKQDKQPETLTVAEPVETKELATEKSKEEKQTKKQQKNQEQEESITTDQNLQSETADIKPRSKQLTENEEVKKETEIEKTPTAADNKNESVSVEDRVEKLLAEKQQEKQAEPPVQLKSKPTILRQLFFEKNSARILPESEDELLMLADILNSNSSISIELSGHTDESGSEELNKKLSLDRAQAVANFMQMLDIDFSRFICKGYGSSRPLFNNDTPGGREKNRRVEFKIISSPEIVGIK